MTAAYGTLARMAYASRTNTTQTLPASTANGNVLLWNMVTINSSGLAPSTTFPGGWTELGSEQGGNDTSFTRWKCKTAWRIAASEPASYTATHTAADSESLMVRITGSGTLSIDVFSQGTHTGTGGDTITAPSVTTTATDDLLLFLAMNWNEVALTPPTGMTERQENLIYLATQALSASGATGTRTQAVPGTPAPPWFGNLYAIKDTPTNKPVKVWSGSAWVTKPVKVWSGSAWVTKIAKVWNGSSWS